MAELSVEEFLNSLNELLDIVPEKKVDEVGIVRVFGNKIKLLLFYENAMKPVAGEAPAEIFYGGRKTRFIKLEPESQCLVVGMKRAEPISKSVFDFISEPESESRKVVGLKEFLPQQKKHKTFQEEAQEVFDKMKEPVEFPSKSMAMGYVRVPNADEAVSFYKAAFGAEDFCSSGFMFMNPPFTTELCLNGTRIRIFERRNYVRVTV